MKKLFFAAIVSILAVDLARADDLDLNTVIGTTAGSGLPMMASDGTSFGVGYTNIGTLYGSSLCSTVSGTNNDGDWSDPTTSYGLVDERGQSGAHYCYCRLEKFTPSGGTAQTLYGPWVYYGDSVYDDTCASGCASDCANYLDSASKRALRFRYAIFDLTKAASFITTQTYVDNVLATKQPTITTTGNSKLMTYGSSAGDISSTSIVITLGTSTTATTVPTTGAVVTGINTKQDAIDGTANAVVIGTGTAGTFGELPVRGNSQQSNALVRASDINSAAKDSANAEMYCKTYVTGAEQTSENCLLWQLRSNEEFALNSSWLMLRCKAPSASCSNGIDCCDGRCDNGTCHASCVAIGDRCSSNSDCCSRTCDTGVRTPVCVELSASCTADGENCSENSDCCSGRCTGSKIKTCAATIAPKS